MCGRYALTLPPDAVRSYYAYPEHPNFPARPNIRPTEPVPVLRGTGDDRHFALVRWGFIPGFVKDEKTFPLLINARSETVFEKPSFRNAIRRRRCVFLADAYYEWRPLDEKGRKKQPFRIARPDGEPLALAGIWEHWLSPNGSEVDTAAILTTSANVALAPIHERMPVIVERADFDRWFSPAASEAEIIRLMRPLDNEALRAEALERSPESR